MNQSAGVLHYAIKWPIYQGKNVYRAGQNAIPIPFIDILLGAILGGLCATILLFFVGWVVGVANYALGILR